jgi:hypothetical protein
MSLENFFNHKCDIYHLKEERASPGYGLAASPSFSYPQEPDIKEQACHFGVKSQSITITQTEPINIMEAGTKLTLPFGVDVRRNDKIVDCDTGIEYTAEQPTKVQTHHLFVHIRKIEEQKAL